MYRIESWPFMSRISYVTAITIDGMSMFWFALHSLRFRFYLSSGILIRHIRCANVQMIWHIERMSWMKRILWNICLCVSSWWLYFSISMATLRFWMSKHVCYLAPSMCYGNFHFFIFRKIACIINFEVNVHCGIQLIPLAKQQMW